MKTILLLAEVFVLALILTACSSSSDQQDLKDFMAEAKRRPQGQIDPLPPFQAYQPFTYSAMTLRSPFERPAPVEREAKGGRTVEPDLTREKEYLENFNIVNLNMVGTLTKAGKLWALIDDGQGKVTPVTVGNYMGKNFGKIISTDKMQVEVMEIVADGSSGWVERPRVIKLVAKE
ncbi:type 4 fimbrial biogenesis protein PilP [Cellvibrio zantedeschiae]|uniref:Type 4 fimbrial biogenesis protein PilP n=1 Tax=Cellvibrio zantedeschiae TaxID=1237077 RepID=A0ABQ3B3Z2_9GAMM|nr:pilus assembly protein PilP [Cellvibrio zantedeschiae]GGY78770.1 type 4 fimbrial biogenesis protein PilP [Cellvibrio zantedeschiae]